MNRYAIRNLIPCRDGEYNGHPFTREVNAIVVNNTRVPIPVLRDFNAAEPVGNCTELRQEADGSVMAVVELSCKIGRERIGIGIWHAADETRDYLDFLGVTAAPDPCGDTQTIAPLDET